ncbi:MAG: multi-sensor hybrid histidine kinase [Myxococcaceae bacterium]|nr:multi-sensor hybrid histidine kinase [Myxococcaceae bacterium]
MADSSTSVWILDDSALECELIERVLGDVYAVTKFLDAAPMLEAVAAGSTPAVLVLDWHMPGTSGLEVCGFLRSKFDEAELPILILTATDNAHGLVEGLSAGGNDFLSKPFDQRELRARVATLHKIHELHHHVIEMSETAARALERVEEANRMKDDFLATVSHELRTPLNAILGWTQMLRSGTLAEEKRGRALEIIERNAASQAHLIEDLLDASRIVSGKLRLQVGHVDVAKVIELAVDTVRPAADAKGVVLDVVLDPAARSVIADPERLQQIVWNLVNNAVKFTPRGGCVRASLSALDEHAIIEIKDSGQGIGPEFLPHVFERFRQAENALGRAQGGLGLGLAIAHHLVELQGGTISAASEGLGLGATFTVRLPMPRTQSELSRSEELGPPSFLAELADIERPVALKGLRVLLVDDEPDTRELVHALLEHCAIQVTVAAGSREALEVIQRDRPDLIVVNVAFPIDVGYAMMTKLRTLPLEKGGQTPSVALGTVASAENRTRALRAGFTTHISTPLDAAELMLVLASISPKVR